MTEAATKLAVNPYVGPRSFQTGEHLYGRTRESAELVDLLIAERIVLLYSPSGAGKSSLVNASIIPQMREQGFTALPTVRVNLEPPDEAASLPQFNRYVYSVMRSLEDELPAEAQYPFDRLTGMTLGQYMQSFRERAAKALPDFDSTGSPLLIFDQFEEVVRVNAADQPVKFDFFAQLGDLLRDRELWALFAIREDYLAAIEPYNRPIPTRFSVTYHLDFLDARSAIEAIQQPAKENGVTFEDSAASKLVDDLRRIRVQQADGTAMDQLGPYVEPVQLQVVCRRLWTNAAGRGTVTTDDVTQAGNIDDALSDYYAFQVGSAAADSGVSERQIREWFDRKLITVHGIRGQVLMEPEVSGGLQNTTIKLLQEAYLVRADKRGNAVWFELAHDRLTRPVRRNNAEWFAANLNVFQRQADLWNTQGRPDSLLLTGPAYLEAAAWVKQNNEGLLPAEKEFFEACGEEHRRKVREHRTNILIRWAAVLMTILAIAALYFFVQAQSAEKQAMANAQAAAASAKEANVQKELAYQQTELANLNEEIAHIRELAAQSVNNLSVDPELSVRLALQAIQGVDMTRPELQGAILQVEDALRQALPAMRVEQVLKDPSLSSTDTLTHAGTVWAASFSADGKLVATAGNDGSLKIWEAASGKLIKTIDILKPASGAYGVTFTSFGPDGKLLAASTGDGRILLYDAATFNPLKSLQVESGVIWGLAFSPDGSLLASGGDDAVVHVWDMKTFQSAFDLVGHRAAIQTVAFSPDGARIASAGSDDSAILWDAKSGKLLYRLVGHTGVVNGVAFSPDSRKLATSGGEDRTIILWDVQSGKRLMTINGHRDWVYAMTFTKDGSNLISVSADRTVRFWDTTYGRPGLVLYGHKDQVYGLALSPDGQYIATTSKDETARIWNIASEGSRELLTINNRAAVYKIAVNKDGTLLATGGGDSNVRLWNPSTAQLVMTLTGHTGIVEAVAFSPDGKKLATGSRDQTAKIWDAATGKELLTFSQHKGRIWDIAFSPDGKRVATASDDETVKIWDPETGDVYQNLPSQWGVAQSLAFSPDGSILAVGYYDSQIVLWDPSSGKQLKVLTGHTDIVETLAFRPDGQVLASAGDDGSIILWDMKPENWGQSQAPMRGRGDTIFDLSFSPDGKFLFSGGADGIGTLWNLEDRQPEFQTYGHTDRIYSVAVNPNGKILYTGGRDGTLRMYVFGIDELIQLANKRTTREFSEDECRQYLNEACPVANNPQTTTATTAAKLNMPGDVPVNPDTQTNDADSSVTASELRANGGDDFVYGTFERPFNGGQMNVYYPDVDIVHARMAQDKEWGYVTITLAGPRGDGLQGNYGVEFDLNVNGRGDLLITTLAPGKDWSTNGVRIWQDKNGDVGNDIPYVSDPPQKGDGYETLLFDQGNGDAPDLAWSRIDPNNPSNVQIAFQLKVIHNDPVFAWTAWASRDAFKPAWFDYNDHFTAAEAGSPLKGDSLYPLQALAGVDNTCRVPVGFQSNGQRGFCQNQP